jgi:hypothetical protein
VRASKFEPSMNVFSSCVPTSNLSRIELRQVSVSSGTLFHLWRWNVAAFAPTPKRCRLPGKRCRFEESTSLLIIEAGLRFVTLVLSVVGIIMNTIYHRIPKRSRLCNSVQTACVGRLVRTHTQMTSNQEFNLRRSHQGYHTHINSNNDGRRFRLWTQEDLDDFLRQVEVRKGYSANRESVRLG